MPAMPHPLVPNAMSSLLVTVTPSFPPHVQIRSELLLGRAQSTWQGVAQLRAKSSTPSLPPCGYPRRVTHRNPMPVVGGLRPSPLRERLTAQRRPPQPDLATQRRPPNPIRV